MPHYFHLNYYTKIMFHHNQSIKHLSQIFIIQINNMKTQFELYFHQINKQNKNKITK